MDTLTYGTWLIVTACLIYLCAYYWSDCSTRLSGSPGSSKPLKTRDQLTVSDTSTLVLSCMDFRLIDDLVYALDDMGYNNDYNNIILAGASLGYTQTVYDSWRKTVDDHIELSQELHNISQIIVVDHMMCGAYKILYNKPDLTREEELELHKENFIKFKKLMKSKYPELKVSTHIIDIDGRMIF